MGSRNYLTFGNTFKTCEHCFTEGRGLLRSYNGKRQNTYTAEKHMLTAGVLDWGHTYKLVKSTQF